LEFGISWKDGNGNPNINEPKRKLAFLMNNRTIENDRFMHLAAHYKFPLLLENMDTRYCPLIIE
jgi:hypothetical protein